VPTPDMKKSPALPEPISLTLEQALQVAGGTGLTANPLLQKFIINGTPWPDLILPAANSLELQQAVNQVKNLAG
jgi:hypothetical protein